jgi:acetolactate synthase-1/2/3 large subunit
MIKLSDYIADFIARQGVKHVFMLPGGGCMHLIDSFGSRPDVECVTCLHEQACSLAAEAYAECRNELSTVVVTTGPGSTNAVTGVADAWLESSSCVFISGQAKRADMIGSRGVRSMGPQEVDIVSVVRPITKYAVSVLDPATIRYHLEKAVFLARTGRRGPVWLEIPLDVQSAQVDPDEMTGYQPDEEGSLTENAKLSELVGQTVRAVNAAQRPVILLGNGARNAFDRGLLERFLETLPVPVLTTWKAIDFLADDHPLFSGRPGIVAERAANFAQQTADCLIVIGARLDLPQIGFNHRNFAPRAVKIVVDVDPREIGKLDMEIHVSICADAAGFIEEFLKQSADLLPRDYPAWVGRCKNWREEYPVVLPEYWKRPDGAVDLYALIAVLSDLSRPDDVLVPESSGPPSDIFLQAFRVKKGQKILNSPGLGGMGTGLPASIGACLASGRKRTICVNGDGGFQLNIQELETVRRLNLPIKFFVLCNGGYASIYGMQKNHFAGNLVGCDPSSGLTFPNIEKIANAYELPTAAITDASNLCASVREVLDRPGPVVCAVNVSMDQQVAPKVTSSMGPDGVLVSKPMEDMWPFLDRDSLREALKIEAPE